MTVHARRIAAIPRRSSTETWRRVCDLVSAQGSAARSELGAVSGAAAMLIAEEYTRDAPIVFSGGGPQVRIYTLHGDDAIEADPDEETPLAFNPTAGDWNASLPCGAQDLMDITALLRSAPRITARDLAEGASIAASATATAKPVRPIIDLNELDSP